VIRLEKHHYFALIKEVFDMSKVFVLFLMCLFGMLSLHANQQLSIQQNLENETTPQYLYKVLSVEDWKKSQSLESVKLTDADYDFIHLAREDQLERIVGKYWDKVPEYVVLKIDTTKLPGKLVFEANPGGENKYYHLYNGSIPLKTVVESKTIKK
jgi:uncharacterized protein (DUF952 family)